MKTPEEKAEAKRVREARKEFLARQLVLPGVPPKPTIDKPMKREKKSEPVQS